MNYKNRISALQNQLTEFACDALIVEDPVNLYYLTGLHLSLGTLFLTKQAAHLFVDGRYIEACQKNSPVSVVLSDPNKQSFLEVLLKSNAKKIGFNAETTTYKTYEDWIKFFKTADQKIGFVSIANPLQQLRSIKDPEEIVLLKQAGELGSEGYDFVCRLLKEGISEKEVADELEIFWKRRGGNGLAFDPIIAFGVNSSMPHYRAGDSRLKSGDCVLIDIGVTYRHYHSDMTRCVFFGDPDSRILEIYDVVKEAQLAALKLCKPGTKLADLDRAARDYITAKGFGKNFNHSLGHGVGLEIHEWPSIRSIGANNEDVLREGMVITIEPGIYLPDVGGIRIEDTVVIVGEGYENLTNRSTDIKQIE